MTKNNKTNRFFYAQTDTFTGDNPREYNAGFANTKAPLAFKSRKDRDAWLSETRLLTAKAITRSEAERLAKLEKGVHYGSMAEQCKPVRVYGTGDGYDAEHVIIAESAH